MVEDQVDPSRCVLLMPDPSKTLRLGVDKPDDWAAQGL